MITKPINSILNNLFFALGNTGDAVLVPAPYYAAFDNDLRAFAGCQTIPVVCANPAQGPTPQELEQAKVKAEHQRLEAMSLLGYPLSLQLALRINDSCMIHFSHERC